MTEPSPPLRTYDKANSFVAISGSGQADEALTGRIQAFASSLSHLTLDADRRVILERAVRALLGNALPGEPEFHLRPHIVAELARLSDAELPRYFFYRYRYDVFPITHEVDAYPPCVQIEPTSICNYRCVFCYQTDQSFTQGRSGHMGQMSIDTFRHIVDQIEGNVEAVTLASRGEPLLCKQIDDMLSYVSGKFLALKINTNAWYLDEKKCHAILSTEPNTLVFSADAADPELYAQLRVNGQLDRVLANVRLFAEIRAKHYPDSRTITRVSGVRYSSQQDFAKIESFWHDYVDQVAFVDYNPWESVYDAPANGLQAPCSDLYRRTFVWWDARVNPCDVDYKSTLSDDNVLRNSLSDLWTGPNYERLRQAHLNGHRQDLVPCKGCVLV